MNGTVSVMGVPGQGMGGLPESLKVFRKHHKDVGDALLNITDGISKDDERAPYVHQSWPTMLYHADGRYKPAADKNEVAALEKLGFRHQPYPKPQVAVLDPAVEKKALMDRNESLQAKLAIQADQTQKLLERLEALEKK